MPVERSFVETPATYADFRLWAAHGLLHNAGLQGPSLEYGLGSLGLYPIVLFNEGDWRGDLTLLDPDPLLLLVNTGTVGRSHDPVTWSISSPRVSLLSTGTFNATLEVAASGTSPGYLNITTAQGSVWRGDIYADFTTLKLIANGAFRGTVYADATEDEVTISGTFRGDMYLGGGSDTVRNDGAHYGRIHLEGGDDTYTALHPEETPLPETLTAESLIFGGAGADRLTGGALNDYLYGGDGNDHIFGGDGPDRLFGGAGQDTVFGNSGHDHLEGGSGRDWLDGGDGNDTLFGQAGRDTLIGGKGADILSGGGGIDTLRGGAGRDELRGDAGDDILTGGGNPDVFVFLSQHDGHDRITDFRGTDSIGVDLDDTAGLSEALLRARLPKTLFAEEDGLRLDLSILYARADAANPDASVLIEGASFADISFDQFIFSDFG